MNLELQAVLRQAQRSPFYSARAWPESWDAVAVTTKQDLRSAYPLGLMAVPLSEVSSYHESSGTSGSPIASLFTEDDWTDIVTRFLRNHVGLHRADMVLVKTPYALVTTAHQMHQAARHVGATVVPADNRSHNMPYTRVVRLLRDLPITVAWCLPTEVLLWAYVARAMGLSPEKDFPHLRAFLVAGEALSPAKKKMLSSLWGEKRIFEDYGSTETGSLAGECAQGNMHLWTDRILFEVRDESSQKIGRYGKGTLLVTPLHRQAMPLLRYELGDQVHIADKPCACGSEFPVVQISGRQGDALQIGSLTLHARDLEQLVYQDFARTQILFWRARPTANGQSLEVEVYSELKKAAEDLAATLRHALGITVEVRAAAASTFLPDQALRGEEPMQKPRFLFSNHENWQQNFSYAEQEIQNENRT